MARKSSTFSQLSINRIEFSGHQDRNCSDARPGLAGAGPCGHCHDHLGPAAGRFAGHSSRARSELGTPSRSMRGGPSRQIARRDKFAPPVYAVYSKRDQMSMQNTRALARGPELSMYVLLGSEGKW